MAHLAQLAVLPVDCAYGAHGVGVRVLVARGPGSHTILASEGVPRVQICDGVVAVLEGAVPALAQDTGVRGAVQRLDVVRRGPIGGEDLVPLGRVVGTGVGVQQHAVGVELIDDDLPHHRVAEIQTYVVEAAPGDHAVCEHVSAQPGQLVVVGDLFEDLGEDVGQVGVVSTAARTEADLAAVGDLLAQHRGNRGLDLVDGQRGPAKALQRRDVRILPLLTEEKFPASVGFLDEIPVPVISGPHVAAVLLFGDGAIDWHFLPSGVCQTDLVRMRPRPSG